jgi:CRP-like cAMP-binding protein
MGRFELFSALSMRHFFGGMPRSFITLELRTSLPSEASARCAQAPALELLDLGDRFGTANPRGISIALNLSHELLASIVGASRQRVTEYLNELDRERMIF